MMQASPRKSPKGWVSPWPPPPAKRLVVKEENKEGWLLPWKWNTTGTFCPAEVGGMATWAVLSRTVFSVSLRYSTVQWGVACCSRQVPDSRFEGSPTVSPLRDHQGWLGHTLLHHQVGGERRRQHSELNTFYNVLTSTERRDNKGLTLKTSYLTHSILYSFIVKAYKQLHKLQGSKFKVFSDSKTEFAVFQSLKKLEK